MSRLSTTTIIITVIMATPCWPLRLRIVMPPRPRRPRWEGTPGWSARSPAHRPRPRRQVDRDGDDHAGHRRQAGGAGVGAVAEAEQARGGDQSLPDDPGGRGAGVGEQARVGVVWRGHGLAQHPLVSTYSRSWLAGAVAAVLSRPVKVTSVADMAL